MSDLNKVILIGRLTHNPELRYTGSGIPVITLNIAVNRKKDLNGEQGVDFIDVVVWRKLAELCNQYLGKGRLIAVDGRLQVRFYETNDGSKRKVVEVIANNVQFLDRTSEVIDNSNSTTASSNLNSTDNNTDFFSNTDNIDDDDIPF